MAKEQIPVPPEEKEESNDDDISIIPTRKPKGLWTIVGGDSGYSSPPENSKRPAPKIQRHELKKRRKRRRSHRVGVLGNQNVADEDWCPDNIPDHIWVLGEGLQVFYCQPCVLQFSRTEFWFHTFCGKGVRKPLNCTQCRQGFVHWTDFERHLQVHYRISNPYMCPQCGKVFRLKKQLTRHKKSHRMSFECPWECGKSVSYKTLLCQHLKWQRSLLCDRCGEVCLIQETWMRHRERCGEAEERSVDDRFSSHPESANHLTTAHRNHYYENRPLFVYSTEVSMIDPPEVVQNILSSEMEIHSNHVKNPEESQLGTGLLHEESSPSVTGESDMPPDIISISQPEQETAPAVNIIAITEPSSEEILLTIKQKKPLPVVCQKCGKRFDLPKKLLKHMHKEHGDLPFPCPKCPVKCANAFQLLLHTRVHAIETKPFVCDRCHKRFCTESSLQKHVLQKHKEVELVDLSFECSECGKGFCSESVLDDHITGSDCWGF